MQCPSGQSRTLASDRHPAFGGQDLPPSLRSGSGPAHHLLHHPAVYPKTVTAPSTPPLTPPPAHGTVLGTQLLNRFRPCRPARSSPPPRFHAAHVRTQELATRKMHKRIRNSMREPDGALAWPGQSSLSAQRSSCRLGLPVDDPQQRPRRAFRAAAALLPVAQLPDRDPEHPGEGGLADAQPLADGARVGGPGDPGLAARQCLAEIVLDWRRDGSSAACRAISASPVARSRSRSTCTSARAWARDFLTIGISLLPAAPR